MVVFTCNTCGESLKKNQVEKHYQTKCRNCEVLSCVDCGKDFWGDDYQKHTKCISEEEKYSGKNYVPKPNANKGEVKQEQWLQQVQAAIEKSKANARLRNVLERMKEYPNIPRKKAKFENFLGNSLNVRDKTLAAQVWELLMTNTQQSNPATSEQKSDDNSQTEQPPPCNNGSSVQDKQGEITSAEQGETTSTEQGEATSIEEATNKLNKRERKEERRKKKQKKEKKDKNSEKHSNVDSETQENGEIVIQKEKKGKKRKHEEVKDIDDDGEDSGVGENHCSNCDTEEEPGIKKKKFDWEATIMAVVKQKGGEVSVKKLKKKVIAEYLCQGGRDKTEEKLWARFDKKIKKNPKFHLQKDRVKIVTSR